MIRTTTLAVGAVVLALALVFATRQTLPVRATTATPTADPCATAGHGEHGGMMALGAGTPSATPGARMGLTGEFDLMFIDMMIPHHESAVAMAQVALTRAERPEIKEIAATIIEAQTREIAQMRAWREAWYPGAPTMPMDQVLDLMSGMMQGMPGIEGMDVVATMSMMGMAMDMAGEVRALCAETGPVDRAFIDLMIPHHESGVLMAKVALQQATHQEIKDLAQAIIDGQTHEIDEMRAWQEAWYGGTPVAG